MKKSIEQQLLELQEQREHLLQAERDLIANGRPYAIAEIKQQIVDFKITSKDLDDCIAEHTEVNAEERMTNGLVKKYNKFLAEYPKYKQAHSVAKVEFDRLAERVELEKPLALNHEFDQFLSWVYETNKLSTDKDNWPQTPICQSKEIWAEVRKLLKGWNKVAAERLEREDAFKHIDKLKTVFKSEKKLRESSDIAIHAALTTLHSYRNALKRGEGKLEPQHIYAPAQSQKLRNSLSYLLFDKSDVEVRIANMCFNPAFDIKGMGVPMITELIGWQFPHEPLINERVIVALRFLGADVEPFPVK